MNSGIRFLTPEAILAGKNPLTSQDLTDFSVYAPEYRNLKYVSMEDLPLAITQVTVPAGQHATYGIIDFSSLNLNYRPITKLWFEDKEHDPPDAETGLLIPIPGIAFDIHTTSAIPITFNPSTGDPLDLTKQIGFFIGSNVKIPEYLYPSDTTYNIYYQIYIDPDEGNI